MTDIQIFFDKHGAETIVLISTLAGVAIPSLISFLKWFLARRSNERIALRNSSIRTGLNIYQRLYNVHEFNLKHHFTTKVQMLPPDFWIIHCVLLLDELPHLSKLSDEDLILHLTKLRKRAGSISSFYFPGNRTDTTSDSCTHTSSSTCPNTTGGTDGNTVTHYSSERDERKGKDIPLSNDTQLQSD